MTNEQIDKALKCIELGGKAPYSIYEYGKSLAVMADDSDGIYEMCATNKTREDANEDINKIVAALRLADEFKSLRDRMVEFEIIVAKLPHTADGVCVHEPMELWLPACYYGKLIKMRAQAFSLVAEPGEDYGFYISVSKCFTTREAAKAYVPPADKAVQQ